MDSSVHSIAKLFRNGLPDQALAYRLASDPLTKATDATELTDNTAPQSALLQVPEALSHPSPLSLSLLDKCQWALASWQVCFSV